MKNYLLVVFVYLFQISLMGQENTELIYVGDPMCSWCYGISEELNKVVEQTKGEMEFQMVMGGLRPFNTQTMPELKDFLTEHWKHVSEASGQKFNYEILDNSDIVYDTEPPSRAVVIIRELLPEKEFEFFQKVQIAFYQDNVNTNEVKTYLDLIKDWNIDSEVFEKKFNSEEAKMKVKSDFSMASGMGVNSFPSLVLKHKDQYYLVLNGFAKSEDIMKEINNVLEP